MDWFELYQFGNLNSGPTDDSDGDGYSNKQEDQLGPEATIVDEVEGGGIAGDCPPVSSMRTPPWLWPPSKATPRFVTQSSNFLEINAT